MHENVRAGLDQRGNALCVVAGVDARADHIALVLVEQLERVLPCGSRSPCGTRSSTGGRSSSTMGRELSLCSQMMSLASFRAGAVGRGDELLARRHEFRAPGRRGLHAAHAVVAARDDAEQLAVGRAVLGDGDGGVAGLLLAAPARRPACASRRDVRVADDKTRLVALHASRPWPLRSRSTGEPKMNEIPPSCASAIAMRSSDTACITRIPWDRWHRVGRLLTPFELYDRGAQADIRRHTLRRGIARHQQIFIEGMQRVH